MMYLTQILLPLALAVFRREGPHAPCGQGPDGPSLRAAYVDDSSEATFEDCLVTESVMDDVTARTPSLTVHFLRCSFAAGSLGSPSRWPGASAQQVNLRISDCAAPLDASHVTPWRFEDAQASVLGAFRHADDGSERLLDEAHMTHEMAGLLDEDPRNQYGRSVRISNCRINGAETFFPALWKLMDRVKVSGSARVSETRLTLASMDLPLRHMQAAIEGMPPHGELKLASTQTKLLVLTGTEPYEAPKRRELTEDEQIYVNSGGARRARAPIPYRVPPAPPFFAQIQGMWPYYDSVRGGTAGFRYDPAGLTSTGSRILTTPCSLLCYVWTSLRCRKCIRSASEDADVQKWISAAALSKVQKCLRSPFRQEGFTVTGRDGTSVTHGDGTSYDFGVIIQGDARVRGRLH